MVTAKQGLLGEGKARPRYRLPSRFHRARRKKMLGLHTLRLACAKPQGVLQLLQYLPCTEVENSKTSPFEPYKCG